MPHGIRRVSHLSNTTSFLGISRSNEQTVIELNEDTFNQRRVRRSDLSTSPIPDQETIQRNLETYVPSRE